MNLLRAGRKGTLLMGKSMTFTVNVIISFPGQMEASLSQFPRFHIITNQSDHWHKIIDPTNILNTLDLEVRNIYLVLEKNCF